MTKITTISSLTDKFLEGKLSSDEAKKLDKLLLDTSNTEFLKKAIKEDYLFKKIDRKFNTEQALTKALKEIEKTQKRTWRFSKTIYKYAAAVIMLLGVASFWYTFNSEKNTTPIVLEISEKNIELFLSNGQKEIIKANENYTITNSKNAKIGHLKGDKLNYLNNDVYTISYNTLKVPYGKKFKVVLSDGTKVDLNSGTIFKYPVTFLEGQTRHVYLEQGEAFFDVTHNAKHKFIVSAVNNHNIEVLGTQFNVSSYKEDLTIQTTLVKGSVRVLETLQENKTLLLAPDEQASWNKKQQTFYKYKVDTNIYTGWRNGELIFKGIAFKDIVKKLERNYDVIITGYSKELANEKFTAKFKDEKIEQILLYFSELYSFNYKINKNKVIIK